MWEPGSEEEPNGRWIAPGQGPFDNCFSTQGAVVCEWVGDTTAVRLLVSSDSGLIGLSTPRSPVSDRTDDCRSRNPAGMVGADRDAVVDGTHEMGAALKSDPGACRESAWQENGGGRSLDVRGVGSHTSSTAFRLGNSPSHQDQNQGGCKHRTTAAAFRDDCCELRAHTRGLTRAAGEATELFAPLRSRAFRWLEGTAPFSSAGVWMITLVGGYIMERLTTSPVLVTLAVAISPLAGICAVAFSVPRRTPAIAVPCCSWRRPCYSARSRFSLWCRRRKTADARDPSHRNRRHGDSRRDFVTVVVDDGRKARAARGRSRRAQLGQLSVEYRPGRRTGSWWRSPAGCRHNGVLHPLRCCHYSPRLLPGVVAREG